MARNPRFSMLLAEMQELHDKKNHDYAEDGNPYSNFEFAAKVAEGFTGIDAVFAVLIGVKLARLKELTAKGKTPNNESINDTRVDLAMYATLWTSQALGFSYDDRGVWSNTDIKGVLMRDSA